MIIIIATITLILCIGGMCLEAYTIMSLFNWFVVSAFGCPELSYGLAWGIGLLVSFLTYHFHFNENDLDNNKNCGITSFEYSVCVSFAESAWSIVFSALTLGFGAIIAAAIGVL